MTFKVLVLAASSLLISIPAGAAAQNDIAILIDPDVDRLTPREPIEYPAQQKEEKEEDAGDPAGKAPGGGSPAASSGPTHLPVYEWERRVQVEERLRTYGPDLLGDQIDPHFGGISFEHTDVSIPGNSSLEVAVRRRRAQGNFYRENSKVEFADWQLLAPRIHALSWNITPWTGNRCSNSYDTSFPVAGVPGHLFVAGDYTQGPTLDVAGAGQLPILEQPQGAQWPAAKTHVTTTNWWFECGSADDGGQGFIGHAPNGDIYYFDTYYAEPADAVGAWGSYQLQRERQILAASEVRDVHGNWVKYDYDANGRLTRIHANDGRQIDLTYSGASKLVSTVQANGRTWTYGYGATTYSENSEIGYFNGSGGVDVLRSVTQPDGRAWSFQLDGMFAKAGPGETCVQASWILTVTHPYGVTGTFNLVEQRHRQNEAAGGREIALCPNDPDITGGETPPPIVPVTTIDAMTVTSKTLSGPNMNTATWTYDYENDLSAVTGIDPTNWTKVQGPDGTHITYYHFWPSYAPAPGEDAAGGKLAERQVRDVNAAGPLLEATFHKYELELSLGDTYANYGPSPTTIRQPARNYQTTIIRNGDYYRTLSTFDTNFSSANYSFGFPTKVEEFSNTSGDRPGARIADTVYEHNKTKWILGLPTSVTRNAKLFDEYDYDASGRRLWHDRFGVRWRTYTYHPSGVQAGLPHTVRDGLNRTTTLTNYKRGEPQTITRPDSVSIYSTVDNNGWRTSETDAKGVVTNYQYNPMGWLSLIDRPSPWADSVITYLNVGAGNFHKSTTHGTQRTLTFYDGMLRPYRERHEPVSGGGLSVVTRREYDIHGRETFASFPDTYWFPANGAETTYDGLGRPTQIRENVAPFATTAIDYLAGAQTRTTDPEGNVTTTTTRGYGAPEDGGVIKIEQPTDITTHITRTIYGNMTSARQLGAHNGHAVDEIQIYYYDARLRLCRHSVPQTGDTLYAYDDAYQLVGEARGQSAGVGCAALPAAETIARTYDPLGRVELIDYPTGTWDTTIDYDNNGNVTQNSRGGAVWDYEYNTLNLLNKETLSIDGYQFRTSYAFTPEGFLQQQLTPGNRTITYAPNGIGQATEARANGVPHATGITYHPNGVLEALTYQNGFVKTVGLTDRQLVTPIRVDKGAVKAVHLAYAHDRNGRITIMNNHAVAGQDRTFAYDGAGRLVTATGPWGTGSFEYDSLGNLRQKTLGTRVVDLEYDDIVAGVGTGRLLMARDTADGSVWRNYVHDERGNVTDNDRLTFTYDWANQPASVSGAASGSFRYDGNLKRVKQIVDGETTYSVYGQSGALLFRRNVTTGVITDYIRVAGETVARTKNGVVSYLHQDHLGSPVAAADLAGAIEWREDYTPFGEERQDPAANDNDENFTGHVRDDALGLIYAQARYMDPVIGRFLSGDPVGFSESKPQMFNRYSYTSNDPINKFDPDGREECGGSLSNCTDNSNFTQRQPETTSLENAASQVSAMVQNGRETRAAMATVTATVAAGGVGGLAEAAGAKIAASGAPKLGAAASELMGGVSEIAIDTALGSVSSPDGLAGSGSGPTVGDVLSNDPLAGTSTGTLQPGPLAGDPTARPIPEAGKISPSTQPRTRIQKGLEFVRGAARFLGGPGD